jgi:glycosyltransferase involved in cell wall biosynthesis
MSQVGHLLYVTGYYLDGKDASTEHVREIASHLAHQGWQVTLVGLVKEKSYVPWTDNGFSLLTVVPIQSRHLPGIYHAIALWVAVVRQLQQRTYDLAYIRPARKTIFAVWWLSVTGLAYFMEVNANTEGEYRAMGASPISMIFADRIERVQFNQARGALCMTHELAEYARDRISADGEVWITGNGFRSEVTSLARFNQEARLSLGVSEIDIVVTFLGSLQPWQGTDLLLEALKYQPRARLWIIGEGPEKSSLEAQAIQLNVADRVHWWGHQDGAHLQRLLSASDIAVGSLALYRKNLYEAQPLKVRHYLGVGLPTIIGYNDTMLNHESPGVFYARTPEEIARRIQEIHQQANIRSTAYRQEIREFALGRLSWAAIARQTSDILSGWLDSNRQNRPSDSSGSP